MENFIRDYNLNIFTPEGQLVTIQKPFTIKFDVTRNTLASANTCNITLTNLSKENRSRLYKDRYTINEYWQIVLSAGYNKIEIVFQGNILECYSYKQGTEWITSIEAYDGMYGIQNGFLNQSYSKNTPKRNIISDAIKGMFNLSEGSIGTPAEGQNPRGQVVLGQSADILNKQTGGQYFIDNEVLNVLSDDEYITSIGILQLDSSLLLSTPKRRDTILECELLFYPSAKIAGLVNLTSLAPEYNGLYKIMGFKHDVTISGAESGTAKTMISLYSGTGALRGV